MEAETLDCPACDGDGWVTVGGVAGKCSFCGGVGTVTPERCEEYHKTMCAYLVGTSMADDDRLHTYEASPDPEFVEPAPEEEPVYEVRRQANTWTPAEEECMIAATTPAEAVDLYRAAYPDSGRTDAAIKTRYHTRIQPRQRAAAAPDFVGDEAPVTQSEEPKGIYGDGRALHADLMDGMLCDRPPSQEVVEEPPADRPHTPWLGMRVQVLAPPDLAGRTGVVIEYNLDPREMLVALDDAPDRIWLPPESLLLIGAGRGSP